MNETKHYRDKNNHIKMLPEFYPVVKKYLTVIPKNKFQTLHRNFREALKWNWKKLYLKINNNSHKNALVKKSLKSLKTRLIWLNIYTIYHIYFKIFIVFMFFLGDFCIVILVNWGNIFLDPCHF